MTADRESTGAVLVDPLGGLLLDPPNELRFKGPFDDYVTVSLTIKNPTDKRIAFKIKTTAPKRYCVKPNSGVLDSAQSMKVNVLLQPFQYDPNEKNKHKFMVQYLYLNDEEIQLSVNDILNMWKDVDSKRLLDLKLKCIFDFNGDNTENQKTSNNTTTNESSSNLLSYQQADTSKTEAKAESASSVLTSATNQTKTRKTEDRTDYDAKSKVPVTNVNTASASTTTPTSQANTAAQKSASSSSSASSRQQADRNDNLANELKAVQKENEALKIEVANLREAEIRLRKLALSSASSNGKQVQATSLADLLQNKLVLIIAVLVAIIFYLLLFR